ncbi:MAG: carbohydrate ABC transporter permease [Betaproteobacteria bacterium]
MSTARKLKLGGMHATLALCAVIVVLPVIWIALAAFKTQIALLRGDFFFTPYFGNFDELLFIKTADYMSHFGNSLLIATLSTVLVLIIGTLAAYSLVRMAWPRWVPAVVIVGSLIFHMIPPITLVGPWYTMFRALGWDNTYSAMILIHVVLNLPIGIAVMMVFVRDVPVELQEAARLDGCSTPRLLWHVILPLVKPGLAATGILAFIFSWNEFAVALNLTASQTATVPVAIAKFAQEYEIKNGVMAAGAVLSIIPAVLVLLLAQRHIVKGLTAGSLK